MKPKTKSIFIAGDHAGYHNKKKIKTFLENNGYTEPTAPSAPLTTTNCPPESVVLALPVKVLGDSPS